MRFHAVKRYNFTAELWDIKWNPTTGLIESEEYRGTMRMALATSKLDNLGIDTEEPIRKGTILRNIRDRNGDLVYPSPATNTGLAYTIQAEQPILNLLGTLEGYQSSARLMVTA